MTSAISSSLSGLQSATQRLNQAASNIVRSGDFNPSTQTNVAGPSNQASVSAGPLRANLPPLPDLATSLVDLKLAEVSYKASAKALSVALEIDKKLLDQIS